VFSVGRFIKFVYSFAVRVGVLDFVDSSVPVELDFNVPEGLRFLSSDFLMKVWHGKSERLWGFESWLCGRKGLKVFWLLREFWGSLFIRVCEGVPFGCRQMLKQECPRSLSSVLHGEVFKSGFEFCIRNRSFGFHGCRMFRLNWIFMSRTVCGFLSSSVVFSWKCGMRGSDGLWGSEGWPCCQRTLKMFWWLREFWDSLLICKICFKFCIRGVSFGLYKCQVFWQGYIFCIPDGLRFSFFKIDFSCEGIKGCDLGGFKDLNVDRVVGGPWKCFYQSFLVDFRLKFVRVGSRWFGGARGLLRGFRGFSLSLICEGFSGYYSVNV